MNALQSIDARATEVVAGIDLRLWLADLDASDATWSMDDVTAAEQERAARFTREADRRRYLASHAALRGLLGTPARWTAGAHGKPALAEPPPHFNLSRRDGLALIGVSTTHEIGVDIEPLREMLDAQALAALHFTPNERNELASCPPSERERAFLRCWTRKEACLKATGVGLSLPPSSFECGTRAPAARVRLRHSRRTWTVLVDSPACAAAVLSWAAVID